MSGKSTRDKNYKLMGTKPTIPKITSWFSSVRKPARKFVEPGICEMLEFVTSPADKKDEKDKER